MGPDFESCFRELDMSMANCRLGNGAITLDLSPSIGVESPIAGTAAE